MTVHHYDECVPLDNLERELVAALIDTALEVDELSLLAVKTMDLPERRVALELRDRIRPAGPARRHEPTRAQEFAAGSMAAEFGRSRVRHQGDGSVIITGMLDDIERRTVCIEPDGRERWRR